MKKLYYLIILTVILGLVLAGCLLSNVGQVPTTGQKSEPPTGTIDLTETNVSTICLTAGGGNFNSKIDVGVVNVWNDADNLYVEYVMPEDGWCLTETHLHVAESWKVIPQKNGNPIPGKFDYNDEHEECLTEFLYTITLPENWVPDTELYIAAHAVVCTETEFEENDAVLECETAWAGAYCGGTDFPGKNWATYFKYEVQEVQQVLLGNWQIDVDWRGSHYLHDMSITAQDASGDLTGTGRYPISGPPYSVTWELINSSVTDSNVTLTLDYDGDTYQATLIGTMPANGNSMSGDWSSNASQSGTWTATRVP